MPKSGKAELTSAVKPLYDKKIKFAANVLRSKAFERERKSMDLTPKQIVHELNKYIIGQADNRKSVV